MVNVRGRARGHGSTERPAATRSRRAVDERRLGRAAWHEVGTLAATMAPATTPGFELAELIADTEARSCRSSRDRDPSTHGRVRDGPLPPRARRLRASAGKRMRPLLGLLAYASITGEHEPRPAGRGGGRARPQLQPRPRRHRGRATASAAIGRRCGRCTASRRRSTPATCCSASAGSRSTG